MNAHQAPSAGSTSYSVRVGRLGEYSVEWREHSKHGRLDDAEWMAKYLRLVKGKDWVEVYQVTETEIGRRKADMEKTEICEKCNSKGYGRCVCENAPSSCTCGLPCSISDEDWQWIWDNAAERVKSMRRRGIRGQQVTKYDTFDFHIAMATLEWAAKKSNAEISERRPGDSLNRIVGLPLKTTDPNKTA